MSIGDSLGEMCVSVGVIRGLAFEDWHMNEATVALVIHILIELAVIVRVVLRPHREPASRIAWIVVVAALPVVGILTYLLFGEVNIGRRRIARMKKVIDSLPPVAGDESRLDADIPERYRHLFRVGHSISGFGPPGYSLSTHLNVLMVCSVLVTARTAFLSPNRAQCALALDPAALIEVPTCP